MATKQTKKAAQPMLVIADDGSTATKLAWFEGDDLKVSVTQNRAEFGTKVSFGDTIPYTYNANSAFYTFNDYADSLPTSSRDFQFSPLARASVQHALQLSGIESKEIDLCVTVPLNMYFNNDGSENDDFISSKKDTHLGDIIAVGREAYKINSVKVYPEGLPAAFNYANDGIFDKSDTTLLIDFGGTTLDLCAFVGNVEEVKGVESYQVGTLKIVNAIKSKVHSNDSSIKITDAHADQILRTGSCPAAYVEKFDVAAVANTTVSEALARAHTFIAQYATPNKIILCGGGAPLLEQGLKELFSKSFVLMGENSQLELARSIAMIEKNRG